MSNSLDGKVALVTGGGGGIGRETAKVLVDHGARVVVADLSEDAGNGTLEYIDGGDAVTFVRADVTDLASMQHLVQATVDRYGRLDVAHNNAGIEVTGPDLADVTVEQFDKVIAVNLTGVFISMKAEIPQMLAQGGGSIINTASSLGQAAIAHQSAYVTSKHGVIGLTRAAAVEYSDKGIRVNAVLPGVIQTPMIDALEETYPGFKDALLTKHPIGRLGTPHDIAEMVAWLGSDAAAFATGSQFAVDGGYLAI
ncbi:glucose 1-dehydrogenase [Pseudokineococcus basanitobsidens]|uniref:Glucose 1-dehydrogenase n=1 Tax=Pseudokineococcus basanitobsidens TaxID=1926649 RepID=A0ABU8RPV0_9ACTN